MRIASGSSEAYQTLDEALSELAAAHSSQSVQYASCPLLNISVCEPVSASSNYSALLWNPLARPVRSLVRLPVYGLRSGQTVTVRDASNRVVDSDLLPVLPTAASLLVKNGSASHAVAFVAHVPALGYNAFSVTADQQGRARMQRRRDRRPQGGQLHQEAEEELSIESGGVRLTFNSSTGLLSHRTDKSTASTRAFSQNFYWYESSNTSSVGCSNAYYVSSSSNTVMHCAVCPSPATCAAAVPADLPIALVCVPALDLSSSLSRAPA